MERDVRSPTEATGLVDDNSSCDTQTALAAVLARFSTAWSQHDVPPDLAAFIPDATDIRNVFLVELIKVDMKFRSGRAANPKRLAEYLAEFPELRAVPLSPDLLYEEFFSLRRAGVAVDPAEYSEDVRPRLSSGDYRSTLIVRPRAVEALDALETLEVGSQIDDFDLLLDLGRGAFARVFLARQRSMHRLVALKVSHNHGTEPQTLAQLDHPYIVRVFDQRLLAERDLKLMYMEYVPGGTLLDLLQRAADTAPAQRNGALLLAAVDEALGEKGSVPVESGIRAELSSLSWPETVAWLGRRLAESLDYSAQHGVLHRDIKPANVLLTMDGAPQLADFNISFNQHIPGATPAVYFGGSLPYMSPEQLEACHPGLPGTAESLDGRSDIYALGVMLWELLTCARPFADETCAGDSPTSLERMLALRRRGIEASALDDVPADCPATLRRVLLTCLAPRPERRWSSGAELAQQLALSLDARARSLVDPPHGSLRERLALRPIPVATSALVMGQILATAYIFGHNVALLTRHLPAETHPAYTTMVIVVAVTFFPAFGGLMVYVCRNVITVPWGVRTGKWYNATTLARARHDTLVCADRLALIAFTGWLCSLVVLGGTILVIADLRIGLIANLFASQVVTATIAAIFPFLLVTAHVVRWYYPALLMYGSTTPDDAKQLRRLARRCGQVLVVTALTPLLGIVAGVMFLGPQDLHLVIDSIIGLGVVGAIVVVGGFVAFRIVDADIAALVRVVSTVLPHRVRS
ncbi:serine/threonine-protein kinase [Aldersonia kunmingensis]|uniref:serine/threonine-protein kinase n=1 Tax=Aldersonia kunmingensis TaxID=408066 RepID=UPI0009FBC3D2|nr:serine/threonine-protein kinase [Aldersonia kunmingensis]